jgi:hypothetical protein
MYVTASVLIFLAAAVAAVLGFPAAAAENVFIELQGRHPNGDLVPVYLASSSFITNPPSSSSSSSSTPNNKPKRKFDAS